MQKLTRDKQVRSFPQGAEWGEVQSLSMTGKMRKTASGVSQARARGGVSATTVR